jgi:hypothetical protein
MCIVKIWEIRCGIMSPYSIWAREGEKKKERENEWNVGKWTTETSYEGYIYFIVIPPQEELSFKRYRIVARKRF